MFYALMSVVLLVLSLYTYVVIAAVIASWLVGFGVINVHNQFARSILGVLEALTDPVFRQIRRVIPVVGGLDLSPLIVLLIIFFLRNWILSGSIL